MALGTNHADISAGWGTACLLERKGDDLGLGVETHRRAPGPCAARCIDDEMTMPLQAVIIALVYLLRDESEKKDLAVVSMAGELKRYPMLLCHI